MVFVSFTVVIVDRDETLCSRKLSPELKLYIWIFLCFRVNVRAVASPSRWKRRVDVRIKGEHKLNSVVNRKHDAEGRKASAREGPDC